jgi:nucleotide-binding universal stress UspA family protein
MKKILLPTDFSENAWNAIAYALELFKNENCTFFILHTYTPLFYRLDYMMGGPEFSAVPDVGVDISLAGLEKTLADIKLHHPNKKHHYKTVSAFNTLTDEINTQCENHKIDLIVMGTQGATGAKEILLGTNTVYVIRKAIVPVLAIPERYRFKPIAKILFAVDYWSRYKEAELKFFNELIHLSAAKLTVMHADEEHDLEEVQTKNKAHLLDYFERVDAKFEEMKGKYMPNAVHDYITEHNIDLLAMMNRKHSFLERLLVKQNIDAIGYHVKIPFLVMKDSAKISK